MSYSQQELMASIGRAMRKRRDALGLSVADLSERAQYPIRLIHSFETLNLWTFLEIVKHNFWRLSSGDSPY